MIPLVLDLLTATGWRQTLDDAWRYLSCAWIVMQAWISPFLFIELWTDSQQSNTCSQYLCILAGLRRQRGTESLTELPMERIVP